MERRYIYQALTPWRSIRLLRLAPSMDASEALQGQLFEYALEDVYDQAFPYEALSYVWGDPKTLHAIAIGGIDLPITANLHDALKRLRDKRNDRLLWVDALCIDQQNDEEKEHQIQLMYQIYACANCVVVWLGEEYDESGQALEDLRTIGRQEKEFEDHKSPGVNITATSENNDQIIERIGKLFQRAWFRRIWVLQEVGAARRVQIRCGDAALDGYAFALAASRLKGSFRVRGTSEALQRTIQSAAYLIKGSIFRPAYQAAEAPSERVGTFGELVNMFHDREATVAHDKIYALLGMSSDEMSKSGLLPDYKIPRGQLFQRMVEFIISDKISVECRNDKEIAVIKARANVLGYVSSVPPQVSISGNTQKVMVDWKHEIQKIWPKTDVGSTSLSIQVPAIPLQQGDILCVLDGATALTIIRPCQDFAVIVAAATIPWQMDWFMSWEWLEQLELPVYNLVLIWDWHYDTESYPRWADYALWADCIDWMSAGPTFVPVHRLDVLSRRCELALICLETLRVPAMTGIVGVDYEKEELGRAQEELERVLSYLDAILQAEEMHTTARGVISALLCGAVRRHSDTSDPERPRQALQKDRNPTNRVLMLQYRTMEKRCKILPRIIMETGFLDVNLYGSRAMTVAAACGYLDVVDLLLKEGAEVNERDTFDSMDELEPRSVFPNTWETTALQAAAGAGHLMIVERLLQEKADVDSPAPSGWRPGRTALQAAAEGGHVSVVERLLQENADVNAPPGSSHGLTALQAAAGAGCMTVVERLIQQKADVNAKTCEGGLTALQKAAGAGHLLVVERLLQAKADVNASASGYRGRTALEAASEGGHLAVVERLLEAKAEVNNEDGTRSPALGHASHRGHDAVVERLKAAGAI